MKNKFQSNVVSRVREALTHDKSLGLPRQWKVIASTLLLLFTLGIGQMWGDVVINLQGTASAASKKAAQIGSMDAYFGRCGNAMSLAANGLPTGNSTIFVAFKVATKSEIVLTCYCTASSNYTKTEYLSTVTWSNITNMVTTEVNSTPAKAYFETTYDEFTIQYNQSTQKNQEYEISLGEYEAGSYAVYLKNSINSAFYIRKITLKPSCAAGAPGNISKGTLNAGVLPLTAAGTAASGDTWYWQTAADGTSTDNSGSSFNVSAAGTYYIRSYNTAAGCWSDAKSITVSATDLVANYTVVYKDGTTELGSEVVEVGKHPKAEGITTTKEFYTFAAWQESGVDKDLDAVSAAKGETVTLTARYTAQYTSGTYEFTGHLTMGTDPQMTISNSSDGQNYAAGRIDNIYVSAQKIGYQNDGGDYDGWKLKTTNGTVRFMVENTCGIRVTIGEANPLRISYTEGGIAKSADIAKSTTSAVYKADANSLVTLTNFTGSNKTVTLKKIEILPLYNATFTDETGDADGSENNVAEVTLPTPTETTVGTSTFTGWTANKVVYDGETAKAVGAALEAGKTYKLTDITVFTAQWAAITDFDVKFFPGYEPNTQIGETQSISTGNYATAPADPSREGYNFKGWSYDATEEHIVDVASYAITAATNFTAIWKQVFAVTFDGAGSVNVESGSKVASPNSPSQAGKVFQGWYNGESKYDFSAAVTGNLALISKWATADANHYTYAYDDAFHFDGVVYKTPEGKTTDPEASEATLNLTTPYTLFSGAEGITSIVATKAVYDYKKADNTKHITAYLKLKKSSDDANSKLIFTIASGYTAVLKVKMGGYSKIPTVTLKKGDDAVTGTPAAVSGKAEDKDYAEITYNLVAGVYEMTTADQTLYFSHIDLQATALPTSTVTYVPGEGTGDEVVDNDATMVADCPAGFTAPEGKIFNGWKDGDNNDVEVGATVTESMTLTAQWINQYAVTFDMQGHGTAVDPQYIKHGEKATKPADPVVIGQEFGGWYTEAACENAFDFNTTITEAKELFAKWTAFTGCVELWPATSGDALIVGAMVDLQAGSVGGSIKIANLGAEGSIAYNANGLSFSNGGKDSVLVTLNNDLKNGSIIKVRLMANGGTKDNGRGLNLYNAARVKKALLGWQANEEVTSGDVREFTYTVVESDGFAGTNVFTLQRQNSVFLQSIKVEECGAAIVYHNVTSEVNIAGKGTVALGASSVREGYTTTAEYTITDPLYEFVSWEVSGEGATLSSTTANPVTITMGTEDAVVTLNLQLKPVKFTVNYYEGTTLKGTEEVTVNEYPTAAGIETTKAHYIFEGWAESPTATAADVIDLATLTSDVAAIFDLYAIYSEIPCPVSGNVFSMTVTDPEDTEYLENNAFGVEIGATYVGGKAYSGSKSDTKRKGAINSDGEYSFGANGEVAVKIEMDCALQAGDVISFTNSNTRQLIIQKVVGTNLYTTVNKSYTIPANSPLIDEYEFYLMRDNSGSTFKTFTVYRPAKVTGVSLENATIAIGNTVTPTMTLLPSNEAYYESIAWSIVGEGEGTVANINAATGAVTALAAGSVTVQVKLNNSESLKATCTVEVVASLEQVDVTESTVWDMNNVSANAIELTGDDKGARLLLANIDGVNNNSSFNSQALMFEGQHIGRTGAGIKHLAGRYVQFNVTVPGAVFVTFESNGNNARTISINGQKCARTTSGTAAEDYITYALAVEPGSVEIVGYEGESANQYVRISKIEFKAEADYTRSGVNPSRIGTLCLPKNAVLGGAKLYEMDGTDANGYLNFLEVENNVMVAGRPYVFVPENGRTEIVAYYTDDEDPVAAGSYRGMVGTFTALSTITDGMSSPLWNNYIISNNHFIYVDSETVSLQANRAYIVMGNVLPMGTAINTNNSNGAPRRRLVMEGQAPAVTTGIDNFNAGEQPTKMIIDGQLYIIRGEKMFDATGRLVK